MKILLKIFISSVFVFFVLLGASVVLLQTDYGKTQLQRLVQRISKSKGISINFNEIKGLLPFQWTFTDLAITIDETKIITAKDASFRLSLLPLIKRTLSIKTFHATNVQTSGFADVIPNHNRLLDVHLPLSLQIKSFEIKNFYVPSTNVPINLQGKARLQKDGSYLSLQTKVERDGYPNSFVAVNLKAERNRLVQLRVSGDLQQLDFLAFAKSIDFESQVQFRFLAKGPFESFENFLFQNIDHPTRSITGSIFLEGMTPLHAKAISWELLSDFAVDKNRSFVFSPLVLTTPAATLKGDVLIEKMDSDIQYSAHLQSDSLAIYDKNIADININFNAAKLFQSFDGKVNFDFTAFQAPFEGGLQFNYQKNKELFVDDFFITSDGIKIDAAIAFETIQQMSGKITAVCEDLTLIDNLFPLGVNGKANIDVLLETIDSDQMANIYVDYSHLQYKTLYSNNGLLQIFIQNLFNEKSINIDSDFKDVRLYSTYFKSLMLKSSIEGENWPFEISLSGQKIQSTSTGFWRLENSIFDINVQDANGTIYAEPFVLKEPFSIKIEPESLEISQLDIEMRNASLLTNLEIDKDNANIEMKLQGFPIDLLSINPLQLDIDGSVSGTVALKKAKNTLNGNFSLNFPEVSIFALGDQSPFRTNGYIRGEINDNLLNLAFDLSVQDEKIFELDAEAYIGLQLYPFSFLLQPYTATSGKLYYNGEVQEILDFFDLRFNFIQGDMLCDLTWEGTTNEPLIEGDIYIKNGTYENYVTGTYLENIQAQLKGDGSSLELISFTARDSKEGAFTANGKIYANYLEKFPFSFQAQIDDFIFVNKKNIFGSATGNITIDGNLDSAITKGKASITYGEFDIPEKIATKVPIIDVQYKNLSEKTPVFIPKRKFPLYLDIDLEADNDLYVRGRGLSSEWNGNIKLEGLYYDLQATGRLDMIKGEFNFSGHYFDLNSGELIFTGDKGEFPFLNISAQTNVQGINIIAKWTGQINEPSLQFSSLPPLPMSSILSYLLFGSDISEITALQAVTLATTAASLSGGGADILELTRRRLGFDRLAIISAPTSEGEEDFAVQIGKYITKGVLVTFSQGLEQGSSNVSVEVDLTHGFLFEAQTIQQQEQGRFSLKWNRNF